MRLVLLEALEKKYEAEIAAADATIKIYLTNSVGIGEHPQHLEEMDKLLQKIVDAQEKLKELKDTIQKLEKIAALTREDVLSRLRDAENYFKTDDYTEDR